MYDHLYNQIAGLHKDEQLYIYRRLFGHLEYEANKGDRTARETMLYIRSILATFAKDEGA